MKRTKFKSQHDFTATTICGRRYPLLSTPAPQSFVRVGLPEAVSLQLSPSAPRQGKRASASHSASLSTPADNVESASRQSPAEFRLSALGSNRWKYTRGLFP